MARLSQPKHEEHWKEALSSLSDESSDIIKIYPDTAVVIKQVTNILSDLVSLAGCTPVQVGGSDAWKKVVENAKQDRLNFCQILKGKRFFLALCGTYTVALNDLKIVLKESVCKEAMKEKTPTSPETEPCENEGFRQQRQRKRNSSSEDQNTNKKPSTQLGNTSLTLPHKPVSTRNYYAPLRSADMDVETGGENEISEEQQQQEPASKQGRPPPIVLTSSTNLIHLQQKLRAL
jgi:hypothetical protein